VSETDTVTAQPSHALQDKIREVLAGAPEPLKFADLKKALKLAGVPTTGKKKVTDDEIKQALDFEMQQHKAFEHEGKKYSVKPPLSAEEQLEKTMREKIASLDCRLAQ
jgi:hypothetical protein